MKNMFADSTSCENGVLGSQLTSLIGLITIEAKCRLTKLDIKTCDPEIVTGPLRFFCGSL